ncbi:hypothetical protein [Tahibacter caeni]|uniref:hypothetical protein n=1 Tax=Tahibacter caeni TaxID=1453545 RepID=UPI002147B2F2|nr:hypothetical protein [Tahibacter caeni]
MTTNTGGIIGSTVTGDGNIAGNGNIVQIDKSRDTNHYGSGHGDRGGSGGDRSDGEAGPFMFGAVALSLAIVGAAFVFAKHAPQYYLAACLVALFQVSASMCAVIGDISGGRTVREDWREWLALAYAIGVALLIYYAWRSYPPAVVDHANAAASMREFWCGLTEHGHGVAVQHVLAAAAISLGLALNMPHAIAGFLAYMFGEYTPIAQLAYRAASVPFAVFAWFLAVTAGFVLIYLEPSAFSGVAGPFMGCATR